MTTDIANQTAAWRDVLTELGHQISEADDKRTNGSTEIAAACYLLPDAVYLSKPHSFERGWKLSWPWPLALWKPGSRRQNLVRAAALILGEIERMDRSSS